MNAVGWQVGAVLIGVSSLIVAIYVAKLLSTTNKVVDKVYGVLSYNERYINETVENVTFIAKDVRDIIGAVSKLSSVLRIFKVFKK